MENTDTNRPYIGKPYFLYVSRMSTSQRLVSFFFLFFMACFRLSFLSEEDMATQRTATTIIVIKNDNITVFVYSATNIGILFETCKLSFQYLQ